MIKLEKVSLDKLQTLLDEIDEKVPTQREHTAIGRKLGLSTGTLAELNDVSNQTIRNWLNRFENQPIDDAPYDDSRSGRPPKLTDEEKIEFFADLNESPENVGYDRQVWFPALGYRHLKEAYNVEYSPSQIYWLLHEAGLSWRTARPRHYEADSETEAEFQETVQKSAGTDRERLDVSGGRSIYETRPDRPTAGLAPDWIESHDRRVEFTQEGHLAQGCYPRRRDTAFLDRGKSDS